MNMSEPGANPPLLRRACGALGLYACFGGALSFGGWALGISRLTDWFQTGISIQPNTALCGMFCGWSLLLLLLGRPRPAAVCGAAVALIGGLTLTQWLTGLSFGIDAVLLFDRDWGGQGVVFPGRMGPPASLAWTLIGTALALTATGRAPKLGSALALLTTAISALSLVGYLYGAEALFALPYLTAIALQTSTFVMAVSLGIIARHPESEPVRTLSTQVRPAFWPVTCCRQCSSCRFCWDFCASKGKSSAYTRPDSVLRYWSWR